MPLQPDRHRAGGGSRARGGGGERLEVTERRHPRHVERQQRLEGRGERPGARVGQAPQRPQGGRGRGPEEILAAEEEVLVARVGAVPQVGVDAERHQRDVDDPGGEVVQLRPEVSLAPSRVLVVAVPDLVAAAPRQGGHVHAVVVEQPEVAVDDQHVAVLQVAVGDARAPQGVYHLRPAPRQVAQRARVAQAPLDVEVERIALDPLHLEDGMPPAAHPDPVRQVVEPDGQLAGGRDGSHPAGRLGGPEPRPTGGRVLDE